eukprot:scaffold167_cov110-Cylindrotheca_fusiformis.AAC.1
MSDDGEDKVIDWDEAMQQCGEDEEFLRELLDDLRSETDAQMEKMAETIESPGDSPFVQIMRASHVIKGAASNLMCAQLRKCAMELETTASAASKTDPDGKDKEIMKGVEDKFKELEDAVKRYHEYLESVGV